MPMWLPEMMLRAVTPCAPPIVLKPTHSHWALTRRDIDPDAAVVRDLVARDDVIAGTHVNGVIGEARKDQVKDLVVCYGCWPLPPASVSAAAPPLPVSVMSGLPGDKPDCVVPSIVMPLALVRVRQGRGQADGLGAAVANVEGDRGRIGDAVGLAVMAWRSVRKPATGVSEAVVTTKPVGTMRSSSTSSLG